MSLNNIDQRVNIDQVTIIEQLKLFSNQFKSFVEKNPVQNEGHWQYLSELLIAKNKENIYKELIDTYKYIISLPVTQNKCESDFSVLKRVKNCNKLMEDILLINLGRELLPEYVHTQIIDMIANSSKKLKTLLIHK